jgi:hypothetical protein
LYNVQQMMGSMTSMKGVHHFKAAVHIYIVKEIAIEVMVKVGTACNVHYSALFNCTTPKPFNTTMCFHRPRSERPHCH